MKEDTNPTDMNLNYDDDGGAESESIGSAAGERASVSSSSGTGPAATMVTNMEEKEIEERRAMEEARPEHGKTCDATSQTSTASSSSTSTTNSNRQKEAKDDDMSKEKQREKLESLGGSQRAFLTGETDSNSSPGSFMQTVNQRAEFAKAAEKAARDASMTTDTNTDTNTNTNTNTTTSSGVFSAVMNAFMEGTEPMPMPAAPPTPTLAASTMKGGGPVLNPLSAQKAPGAYRGSGGRVETVDYNNAFSNRPAPNTPPPLVLSREEQEQSDRLAAVEASAVGEQLAMEEGGTQEQERSPSPLVMEGTLEEDSTIWWKRKPVMLAMLLVIIVAIVVPIVIVLQSNSSSEAETVEQKQQQQQIDEETIKEEWVPLVPNMTNATLMSLEDPFSQQSQAYEWIADDPDWDTYEDWRKQQRFAMMCLYYGFRGSAGMSGRFTPTRFSHECEWLRSFRPCEGNDNGKISNIGGSGHVDLTFSGTFPPEISFLTNLKEIHYYGRMEMGELEDIFPLDTINSLPPIETLTLRDCGLGGSIPSTLGLITSLTSLNLPNTELKSTIPSQLGLLSDLETLTLSSNALTGSIPKEIGELPSLKNFDVRTNPELEPPIAYGFCVDGRAPFESLITDWCFSPSECCGS